jgi:tetratricopeptide (TPR) repeat protein
VKQVGRELGVRYVLEGSVRKAGGRVRITGQLIDAANGAHLWADRFDGSLEDVFDLQDKVASSVAGVIEPALQAAETARSAGQATTDLTAYDLYLRANAMHSSAARQNPEALRLMEQAIERDPRYGPALGLAAICCVRVVMDGRSKGSASDHSAVAGDHHCCDPGILGNAALGLAYFGEDLGAATILVERALALNPNFARGWHISGILALWAGQPDLAIGFCGRRAKRPRSRQTGLGGRRRRVSCNTNYFTRPVCPAPVNGSVVLHGRPVINSKSPLNARRLIRGLG